MLELQAGEKIKFITMNHLKVNVKNVQKRAVTYVILEFSNNL